MMIVPRERKFCAVCHQLSDGTHFGAIACKACAAFFRRSTFTDLCSTFVCRKSNECVIKMSNRDSCKACRYEKCKRVGMNPEAVPPPKTRSTPSPDIECISTPSSSCSSPSHSPIFMDFDEYRETTPLLCSLMEKYQQLYRKRYASQTPKTTPRAIRCGEFSDIYVSDVYLQHEFLEDCFPQFKEMPQFEKKHVFKNFFISFLVLEMGYRSYQEGRNVFVLANGDFIDTMNLDEYYHDPNHIQRCLPTDAVKMYAPFFDQMRRNVFHPLRHQKVSLIEFLALVTLSTWNDSLEGQPDCYYPHCRPVRQHVIAELMSFYAKDTPDVDPALRLSRILMLLPGFERTVELFVQKMEVKRLFRCFPFHDKLYRLVEGQQ